MVARSLTEKSGPLGLIFFQFYNGLKRLNLYFGGFIIDEDKITGMYCIWHLYNLMLKWYFLYFRLYRRLENLQKASQSRGNMLQTCGQ